MGLTTSGDESEVSADWYYAIAYAVWGKFIELSAQWIPWSTVLEVADPEMNEHGQDEVGKIYETIIRVRHRGNSNDKK